jgi:hypothetical protein
VRGPVWGDGRRMRFVTFRRRDGGRGPTFLGLDESTLNNIFGMMYPYFGI